MDKKMEPQTTKKKVMLSGIQPTGVFTLGNYIGAVRNWGQLQEEYNCIYFIANLHAITVRQDPKTFRQQTLDCYALLLACGIDPQKSLVFIQSQVPTHAELSWILSCHTQFGELSRMTQFKDKSAKHADNVNAGLFAYPALMAADILLYQPHFVPVGADQKQHLELTRDIAGRFNNLYGKTFTIPEPYIPKAGAKIMSLAEPAKKMSKSDENPNGFISILDPPETITKKFRRAVTDSEAVVAYRDGKDGVNNLMTIYSVITGADYPAIEREFEGKGYGDFKSKVADAVCEELRPVRERFEQLREDQGYLEQCYQQGAERALSFSMRTLEKVYRKMGLFK